MSRHGHEDEWSHQDDQWVKWLQVTAYDRCLKWLRVTAYTLMALAGSLLMISPVLTEAYPTTARVMSGFLLVGAVLCVVGTFFERWWGEFMGVPLLASAFTVFGVISFADSWHTVPYLATANLSLLVSIAIALITRWRESRAMYRLAVHAAEEEREEADHDV